MKRVLKQNGNVSAWWGLSPAGLQLAKLHLMKMSPMDLFMGAETCKCLQALVVVLEVRLH